MSAGHRHAPNLESLAPGVVWVVHRGGAAGLDVEVGSIVFSEEPGLLVLDLAPLGGLSLEEVLRLSLAPEHARQGMPRARAVQLANNVPRGALSRVRVGAGEVISSLL